ncbi:multidrug resistance-associated protein 4 [Rhypophila sp. PSN 637]
MAPLIDVSAPLIATAVSSSNYSRLHSADEDDDILVKPNADGEPIAIDPPLFFVSPFQLWVGRLVSRVNKSGGVLDDRWLPKFPSRGSASLRRIFSEFVKACPESGSSRGPWAFVLQFEVGVMVMLGFVLELLSSILSLLAPWILHRLLITTRSVPLAVSLIATTILSTLLGRARDQVCRTHATWIDGMLGSTIFAKALRLSASARVDHPPAKIINLSAVDVAFLSIFTAVNQTIPGVVACTAFLVYWAAGNELSAQVVFPSLAYFNLLSQPVFQASVALSRQFSVKPSLLRISKLLYEDEQEAVHVPPPEETSDAFERPGQVPAAVRFHNATMAYPYDVSLHTTGSASRDSEDEDTIVASDSGSLDAASISPSGFGLGVGDLRIPKGQLTSVSGPTGSGKTSLLLSILGQLSAVSGHITLHGDVSYAAQEPLILSGTFKDNITLGRKSTPAAGHGRSRYRDVLQRTGLDIDLSGCPGGPENAVIGESGSNLSGGQRARVGLARALFSDAEILLLDDPLAAVDARVRNKPFDAFREESRTVVLATLHTQYATKADYIIVLDKNKVVWSGDREAFMANQSLRSKYLSGSHASDSVTHDKANDEKSRNSGAANKTSEITSAAYEEAVGLVEDEERAKGALKWKVLAFYTTAAGGKLQALSVLAMAALLMGARIMSHYCFVWWIDDSAGLAQSTYIGVYLALVVAQSGLIAALGLVLVSGSIRASRAVHDRIVENMLSARVCAREIQRTACLLSSPVLSILSESLSAPATIHAYAGIAIPFLQAKHAAALDTLMSANLVRRSLDTWVTLRAEGAAAMVLALVATSTAYGVIPETLAGMALGVATTLARNVYLLAWSVTDLEIQMNSAERLMVYHDEMPREGPIPGEERRTPPGWPSKTDIVLYNIYVQYKSRAEPVLKGINLEIPAGQRLGIVGRTGSGKSTLLSALARLVDLQSGSIFLTGEDISKIAPRKLRSVVCTLPQEPLISKGTLRRNLDPHGQHRESELHHVLEVCQLRDFLQLRFEVSPQNDESVLLDKELSSGGPELSMGQRQLLCAARMLLAEPKVLLVDEAAANIDFASGALLQRALREMLPESTTMVVIAHRAASLAWMDRIIAMQSGQVFEDDSPLNLLEGRSSGGERSYYASMVNEDGEEALRAAIRVARDRFMGGTLYFQSKILQRPQLQIQARQLPPETQSQWLQLGIQAPSHQPEILARGSRLQILVQPRCRSETPGPQQGDPPLRGLQELPSKPPFANPF